MSETSQDQTGGIKDRVPRLLFQLWRQFTKAGDWKAAIANSKLPAEVQSTITTLVAQTGLMRFEKFEIADELIAHFVDGLERGKKSEELTSAFGEPEVAATLFRSSKLRSRPMAIKVGKITLWTMLGTGTGYLALMAFFNLSSPNPTVDYSIVMNQKAAAVPEAQRAWPVYREAWTKFKFCGEGGHFSELYIEDENGVSDLIRPEDKDWDAAVKKLKDSSELLDAFRTGAKLAHLGLELHVDISDYSEQNFRALYPDRDYLAASKGVDGLGDSFGVVGMSAEADQLLRASIVGVGLPHTQQFRQAALLFQLDIRLAVTENAPDRAVDNIKTILGFARQQKNENFLVCNFVGVSLLKIAVGQVEEIILSHPSFLGEEDLLELQNEIAGFDFSELDFSGEQALLEDLLQRVYTDDGAGDGRLTPEGLEILTFLQQWQNQSPETEDKDIPWQQANPMMRSIFGPALMLGAPGRKEVADAANTLIKRAEARFGTPWWQDDLSDLNEIFDSKSPASFLAINPDWPKIHSSVQNAIAQQDAGLLGIAIERYRLRFDSWPQSMDDLKGAFLDAIPLDRVTGKPLLFKASDAGVVIYSVGGDLDDDGGKHDARTNPMIPALYDSSVDGDWVLWPVDRD